MFLFVEKFLTQIKSVKKGFRITKWEVVDTREVWSMAVFKVGSGYHAPLKTQEKKIKEQELGSMYAKDQ